MVLTTYNEVLYLKNILAPSQLKILDIPNKNTVLLKNVLQRELKKSDNGVEVGSINYIDKSHCYFIRTKALQSDYYIPIINQTTTIPIRPQTFKNYNLKEGDLIISKDSNIGEAIILEKDYPNYMLSGALYRLPITHNKYYVYAFLKGGYFREQLDLLVPKGSTIRHAKTLFLECKIPFPKQNNSEDIIKYVELLTKSIINKEKEIVDKNNKIHDIIEKELLENQTSKKFIYSMPKISDLNNRLDAGLFCKKFKEIDFSIYNYKNGCSTLDKQGLEFISGPSLELKLLVTRIDSSTEKNGYYRLITPTQITNYGTVSNYKYIGTSYVIPKLQNGDILFGESGTGRTLVFIDGHKNTITNAHGHILRPKTCSLEKAIAIRCILSYLKRRGYIDYLTVGGSGGHLSPSYFDRVPIPNFNLIIQNNIAKLYHNKLTLPKNVSLLNFSEKDKEWNSIAGIIELDLSIKSTKKKLDSVLEGIKNDKEIIIEF